MADGKMQTERHTPRLMGRKWSRGTWILVISLSAQDSLFYTPLLFFVTENRLSLVSSEKLKEPRERRGFGKWVNSCPKHSVCGTNKSRFVSLQG